MNRIEARNGEVKAARSSALSPRMSLLARAGAWGTAVILLLTAGWAIRFAPVNVPDTHTPVNSNQSYTVNSNTSVGQFFVPERDNLSRISVVLATLRPNDQAEITFQIKESPDGEPLRSVKRKIVDMPVGESASYPPGTITERWYSFDFEPIPDSAGRELFFLITGEGVPEENSVKLQIHFHNDYPPGKAHLTGETYDAHVLFRASSQGRFPDLLAVLAENLTARKAGPFTGVIPYLVLTLLYLGAAVATVRLASQAARR